MGNGDSSVVEHCLTHPRPRVPSPAPLQKSLGDKNVLAYYTVSCTYQVFENNNETLPRNVMLQHLMPICVFIRIHGVLIAW
jgi:hypothetical protein